jgi:DNA (cytosine-5)-methyltransferase 1
LASKSDLRDVLLHQQFYALTDSLHWQRIEKPGRKFPTWGIAHSGKFFASNLTNFSESIPPRPLKMVLESDVAQKFDYTENTQERIKESVFVNRFVDGVQILYNQAGGARMGYTVFGVAGVVPTLTATTSRHYERYLINGKYRRLTNIEYARLQGFPDNHCRKVSVYNDLTMTI